MGILFIAAGRTSRNREKTLERPHTVSEINYFLTDDDANKLNIFFPEGQNVYAWGANTRNSKHILKAKESEYVVDIKNKKVVQVFKYCFYIETKNTRLQEMFGWDSEKNKEEKRPYNFVYFLKGPFSTNVKEKIYFQSAFKQEKNNNWLVGQRYFNDDEVAGALKRTSTASVESLIGISGQAYQYGIKGSPTVIPITIVRKSSNRQIEPVFHPPTWLNSLLSKIQVLKLDSDHFERDHEDLVACLFELLGYERIHDIKYRRGNIDIRIESNGNPLITVEVKADWFISTENRKALSQAFRYAHETGTPYVIITNGDKYCIYDRRRGLTYSESLISEFSLTSLTENDIKLLEALRKNKLS